MSVIEYLEREAKISCPVDAELLTQARAVADEAAYLSSLDLLNLTSDDLLCREKVRKIVYGRLHRKNIGAAERAALHDAFRSICHVRGWKLPSNPKGSHHAKEREKSND